MPEQNNTLSQKDMMDRDSPFFYSCNQCNLCCHHKIIKLNPYEVSRIADHLGVNTGEVIRQYTNANGSVLKMKENGACIFLTEKGCGIHSDRPLVCRVYPLGRHLSANGEEKFFDLTPHPESLGVYGKSGTVGDYLKGQEADPFIRSVAHYLELLGEMISQLKKSAQGRKLKGKTGIKKILRPLSEKSELSPEWFDTDLVVFDYCRKSGIQEPSDPDQKMVIHIEALKSELKKE